MSNIYTLEDVRKHNRRNDCWVIVDNHVLDLTKFLEKHPFGPDVIVDWAGRDATLIFDKAQHGDSAYKAMLEYAIGRLVDS